MTERTEKADEILEVAEKMARRGGYNGFSFREIAKAVDIKSASVHYHFPTKEDLGAAVAERYCDNFMEVLGDPERFESLDAGLSRYVTAFRTALTEDGLMCLCGVLGAEIDSLPKPVGQQTRLFFNKNIDWLETLLSRFESSAGDAFRSHALSIVAALEGAMILARSLEDTDIFDQVADHILDPQFE